MGNLSSINTSKTAVQMQRARPKPPASKPVCTKPPPPSPLKAQSEQSDLLSKIDAYDKRTTELRVQCEKLQTKLAASHADLSEERAACVAATDALEQESARRLQCEREAREAQGRQAALERKADKLELQLMELRQLKAIVADADDGNESELSAKLQQQLAAAAKAHERHAAGARDSHLADRRQLERRLQSLSDECDALRRSAAASKAAATQAAHELQDVRGHMDRLTVANAQLEKRQRRFDGELSAAVCECESLRAQRDRYAREKDALDTDVRHMRKQLEAAEEDLSAAQRELENATQAPRQSSIDSADLDAQVVSLRAAKCSLESKVAEQECELDELCGRCQQLEASVTRVQMQAESDRQQHRRDAAVKEAELEQARAHMQKRVRQLEQSLEDESEEKSKLMRRTRETEQRVHQLSASAEHYNADGTSEATLRRDLRRTRALLRDSQKVIEQQREQAPSRGLLKQLKNQLEDADAARLCAVKAKQRAESDIVELRCQLETAGNQRQTLEDKNMAMLRDRNAIQASLDESQYEYAELCKKYKAQVQQASVDAMTLSQLQQDMGEAERRVEKLKEELAASAEQVTWNESHTVDRHKLSLAETKIRDMETRLESELTQKVALHMQLDECRRLVEKHSDEAADALAARDRSSESSRRSQLQLSRLAESSEAAEQRSAEARQRCDELEAALERAENEHMLTVADLKLALRRIDNLQAALQDDLADGFSSDEENDDEDGGAETSGGGKPNAVAAGPMRRSGSQAMTSPYPPSTKSPMFGESAEGGGRTPRSMSTVGNAD